MMVREPVAGRVKTRLARDMGAVRAANFYRHTVAAVMTRIAGPGWQTLLAVAPDAVCVSRAWPKRFARISQGRGDLGQRMQRILDRLPPGPVVIVGSDVPGITPEHLREAFRTLGAHDAVVGPSPDGGYWLVGLKRRPKVLRAFRNVRWSSRHARADTLANLEGLRIGVIGELADADEAADLARFRGAHGRRVLPPGFEG
jgi:rSAM/selenodomain-associated transferase 1